MQNPWTLLSIIRCAADVLRRLLGKKRMVVLSIDLLSQVIDPVSSLSG